MAHLASARSALGDAEQSATNRRQPNSEILDRKLPDAKSTSAAARPSEQPPQSNVKQASYNQEQPAEVEPPAETGNAPELIPVPPAAAGNGPLTLATVIASVEQSYPLLQAAFRERQIADGNQIAAGGAFDLQLKAFTTSGPLGFYETYRNGFSLEQPTFKGGYVYGGYKIGRGSFQPWYKERQTNDGGEFALGFGTPLLKNRAIDRRRASLVQAQLGREAVDPAIRAQLLGFVRMSSVAYWSWVAHGRALDAQRGLLRLALQRVTQIRERIAAGDLERIAQINNDQLIAARQTKVIEGERKLQQAAIKLSLFLLTPEGLPRVPTASDLPPSFPASPPPSAEFVNEDIEAALAARPELVELDLIAEQVRVELAAARNSLLPKLDAIVYGSQDVGAATDAKKDKSPFELEAGLQAEVPLQRRAARGKITAATGKLAQLRAKRAAVVNKIIADVRDAVSALDAAARRIVEAEKNLRLARQTLQLGRDQFNAGDSDLIELNIYERAATDAQFLLIAAQADFFVALADYRAALALDPATYEKAPRIADPK